MTLGLCNITAKLPSEDLCSWPPENRSVAPNRGRGPRLRNSALDFLYVETISHPLRSIGKHIQQSEFKKQSKKFSRYFVELIRLDWATKLFHLVFSDAHSYTLVSIVDGCLYVFATPETFFKCCLHIYEFQKNANQVQPIWVTCIAPHFAE